MLHFTCFQSTAHSSAGGAVSTLKQLVYIPIFLRDSIILLLSKVCYTGKTYAFFFHVSLER